jgi:hypothetical protein
MDAQAGTITDVKDLLPIIFERSNAATTTWNIELVLVLGIVAALVTAGTLANQWVIKSLITVAAVLVSTLTFRSLIEITLARYILRDLFRKIIHDDTLQKLDTEKYLGMTALRVTPLKWIIIAYLAGAVLLAAFIWAYPWWASNSQARTTTRKAWWWT